jgi:hypothetical protein
MDHTLAMTQAMTQAHIKHIESVADIQERARTEAAVVKERRQATEALHMMSRHHQPM